MKNNALILMSFFCIISFSPLSHIAKAEVINYDDEFNKASALIPGRKEAQFGTDYLVKNTTAVLHKENMKTHTELEKLRKEIEELRKEIKEVKDIVEGGQ